MNPNCQIDIQSLVKSVSETKRKKRIIIKDFSIKLFKREIVSILGPSGCGKTTLLKLLSGIETPDAGNIIKCNSSSKIGMIFQKTYLFNWLNVEDNIAFGLKYMNYSQEQKKEEVEKYLEYFHLEKFRKLFPCQLSGGMQQRVALARSLILSPGILLLDEPFTGLDISLKEELYELLSLIKQKNQISIVLVTHDIDEAILLSDRILLTSKNPMYILKEIDVNSQKDLNGEENRQLRNQIVQILKGNIKNEKVDYD